MGRLWPLGAIALGLFWLGQAVPAAWPLAVPGWQGPALALLLAGVFGLLYSSSSYLQARVVALVWGFTRNDRRANRAYFTLMRPGVLVHETAHALAALLVGGRVTSFRVLETTFVPGARGGQVRLGHVSYTIPGRAGRLGTRLKDSFVGFAPLPAGLVLVGAALLLSGVHWAGDLAAALAAGARTWQFWVALLAILEVADQMMPSSVDRKNWPAALLIVAMLGGLAWLAVRVFALVLPAAWWATVLQAGLILALVLAAPIAINLLLGAALWLLARPFRR